MIKKMNCTELLGFNKFHIDEEEAHIVLDKSICEKCKDKPCLYACPATLYNLKDGVIDFDYAGCLECGTCRLVCENKGIVKWVYPRGTFGIVFRQG